MADDVRDRYDPLRSIPEWFWERIAAVQADPTSFDRLTDRDLIDFSNEMLDLKTYFSHAKGKGVRLGFNDSAAKKEHSRYSVPNQQMQLTGPA
jgi:hypothetical protein